MTPEPNRGGAPGTAVVAGHLCLDLIPSFYGAELSLIPGTLTEVGPATFATGGGVSNVGLSLERLGVPTKLMGRVGDDAFGNLVKALLEARAPGAGATVRTAPGESTSYTLVISPPGADRLFLHHPGCNDAYEVSDVDVAVVAQATLFYFGYPPLMRRVYGDGGAGLAELLGRVKALGVTTALDMAMPDPGAASGRVDWRAFLRRVLPHVDVFMPNLEETLFMLDRAAYSQGAPYAREVPGEVHRELAQRLLELGAGMVGLKLGDGGLYLRSSSAARLERMGRAAPTKLSDWADRELWRPVFEVEVKGTTGAGDATLAGFLAALLRGFGCEEALTVANAVGAASVEAADAVGGVQGWEATLERIRAGWPRAAQRAPQGWREHGVGVFIGPRDGGGA